MAKGISGFPEFLPQEQKVFLQVMDTIRKHYEHYGFVPIETPAVERVSTLLSKGGNEKEIYGLRRLAAREEDEGDKDLALHFDLTVPLARYVTDHYDKLSFPFRRYQMQPVWRGERAQAGRYRQFIQCDIDTIGDGSLSIYHDAEIPVVINSVFTALNIGSFTIRVNNRKILQGLLASLGLESAEAIRLAMGIIDNLEKQDRRATLDQFGHLGVSEVGTDQLISFFEQSGNTDEIIYYLKGLTVNRLFEEGVEELDSVIKTMKLLGVPESNFIADLSIARGLDYYTGTIYETRLNDHPKLGSICSGGRFDNLATQIGNRNLPGVGMSIGLTRLLPKLIEIGVIQVPKAIRASTLVTTQDTSRMDDYLTIARHLRDGGVSTEVYLEPRKLAKQMKFANQNGFLAVVIASAEELDRAQVNVKNMTTGNQELINRAHVVQFIKDNFLEK